MSQSSVDPVSKVNLMCQKYRLEMKYSDVSTDLVKLNFCVVLMIKELKTKKTCNYTGKSTISKKDAKRNASINALHDDFVTKLGIDKQKFNFKQKQLQFNMRKFFNYKDLDVVNVSSTISQSPAAYDIRVKEKIPNLPTSQVSSPIKVTSSSPIIERTIETRIIHTPLNNANEENPIYDLFLSGRKLSIRPKIEFIGLFNDGRLTVVNLKLDQIVSSGSGQTSLDAIQDAARRLNPDSLKAIESDCLLEEEPIECDAMTVLNKMHVKIDKKPEWKCLLSIEQVKEPMYLYECRFDNLISFGVESTKEMSQNIGAYHLLNSLRIKMLNNRRELEQKLQEIKIELFDLESDLKMIDAVIVRSQKRKSNDISEKIDLNEQSFNFLIIPKKEKSKF